MSEIYVVHEARDGRFDRVGWSIRDTRDHSCVQVVDMESRACDSSDLVFADRDHADDFAAALNLGCKARRTKEASSAWTSEPQEAGAYWHRPPGAPDYGYGITYVHIGTDRKALPAGEWLGPLPEPPPISEGGE